MALSELTKRVAATVGRHFVSLSCVQRLPSGESKLLVFSGFVVEVHGEWFYVTAGHIINDIRASMKAGAKFETWRLDDSTAGQFRGIAIPYDFNADNWLAIDERELGLDYAIVHIPSYYRTHLEAGKVVAIGRDTWGEHDQEHDHWLVVGIPSESVIYDGQRFISARVVMARLEPNDEPAGAGARAENQFYARFKEDGSTVVRDPDGLSGGPIFGLKKDGEVWRYWVIGLQAGWYEDSKVLAACPFSSFGSALEEFLEPLFERFKGKTGTISGE